MKRKHLMLGLALVATCSIITSRAYMQDVGSQPRASEAPTGFDGASNGFTSAEEHAANQDVFEDVESIPDGLGPLYNAQSCRECHQNPITGGISQITELRAGHFDGRRFVEHAGGSLINDRATDARFQERVQGGNEIRTFRTSLTVLGDGFVECIDDNALINIANNQPSGQRGTVIRVPVLEAPGTTRVARFGWKNQHASLVSFAADAYLNEMGITSPLLPTENTSNGRSIAEADTVADPEDDGDDLEIFANFMRATKAPPVDAQRASTSDARAGSQLFDQLRCNTCHVRSITTAAPGTSINGGTFVVPAALGSKVIHPFSDFLLHDVGTGDGIVQNGGNGTGNQLRTPPLWGLRTRDRLMHDGNSLTREDAIQRHGNQASSSANAFRNLSGSQRRQLITFLDSL